MQEFLVNEVKKAAVFAYLTDFLPRLFPRDLAVNSLPTNTVECVRWSVYGGVHERHVSAGLRIGLRI